MQTSRCPTQGVFAEIHPDSSRSNSKNNSFVHQQGVELAARVAAPGFECLDGSSPRLRVSAGVPSEPAHRRKSPRPRQEFSCGPADTMFPALQGHHHGRHRGHAFFQCARDQSRKCEIIHAVNCKQIFSTRINFEQLSNHYRTTGFHGKIPSFSMKSC